MAGGTFDKQTAAANQFSDALAGVAAQAGFLTNAVNLLAGTMHVLTVRWATREIEATAQAFYKLRLSLGATQKGAIEYINTVKSMTQANVISRRSLIDLFGEMRKSSGLVGQTNTELALLTTRLQKAFPQAAKEAAAAIAQIADESANFQAMMSKNISSSTAFAMANARFGSEYAHALLAARGELEDFTNENRNLLTMFAEVSAAADDMTNSVAQSLKTPINGVMQLAKWGAEAVKWVNELGGGQVGKAIAPVAAAGAAWFGVAKAKELGDRITGKDGKGGALSAITGGRGLTPAMPMFVQVVGPQIPVGGSATTGGTAPIAGLYPATSPDKPKTLRERAGARFQRAGGWGTVASVGAGALIVGSNVAGEYQSARQGEKFGWGNVAASAGTGAIAGAMIGSVIPGLGTAIGALTGAVIGLTGAVIANTFAVSGNIEDAGKSSADRLAREASETIYQQGLREAIESGGPSLRGQREAERLYLEESLESHKFKIPENEKIIEKNNAKIKRLAEIHEQSGFWEGISDEQVQELKRLGVDPDQAESSNLYTVYEGITQAQQMHEESNQAYASGIKIARERSILEEQRLLKLASHEYERGTLRSGFIGSQIGLAQKQMTLGAGPHSLANIQALMQTDVGVKKQAMSDYQASIIRTLGYGGADTEAIFGGKSEGEQLELMRALGSMSEDDFAKHAKNLGITEEAARGLLAVYENLPDYAQKMTELEGLRAQYLDDQARAATIMIDTGMQLLSIEQQRMETAKGIASALKASPMIQAQLTAQQIKATEAQIVLEEKRYEMMKSGEIVSNEVQRHEQLAKIEALYGQLANQVDYIRRGWEEVFTQTSLNLPGGSYIMPTMTGLMEKGPAFLPFTPNQQTKDARVMGHGTYESYMGYGKASAFSRLQEHLADVMSGMAGNIEYVTNGLTILGDKLNDIVGGAEAGN